MGTVNVWSQAESASLFAPISSVWHATTAYKAGELISHSQILYTANIDFTSGGSFDATNLTFAGGLVQSIDSDGTVVVGGSIQVPRLSLGDISFIYALNTFLTSQVNPTVYTAATAPTAGKLNQYDCTSGALAPAIPLASSVLAGETIGFKKTDSTANFLTPTCSGSDHIDISTGSTTIVTKTQNQFVWLTSDGTSVWTKTGGDFSLASLDLRFQPLDSDLTAIAALSTTSFGRAVLALADAAALRTAAGLGTLATQSGTFSGTSSGTNTGDQTLPVGGIPAVVLGTAAAAGTSPNFLRRDDTIAAFDATVPSTQAFGDAAAVGTATVAPRRDHKHAMPATTKDKTAVTGLLKGDGTSVTAAAAGTDYAAAAEPIGAAAQTTANAAIPKSVATTKGDILVATGSATVTRQGIGADTYVLTADSAQTNGLKWATPLIGSRRVAAGQNYPLPGMGQSFAATTSTLNQLIAFPFAVDNSPTLTSMICQVQTGTVAGALFRLGIYLDNGSGLPGTLLLDAGTVDCSTVGVKTATVSQVLGGGPLFWVAFVAQVAQATMHYYSTTGGTLGPPLPFGSGTPSNGIGNGYISGTSTSGALPGTFGTASSTSSGPNILKILMGF